MWPESTGFCSVPRTRRRLQSARRSPRLFLILTPWGGGDREIEVDQVVGTGLLGAGQVGCHEPRQGLTVEQHVVAQAAALENYLAGQQAARTAGRPAQREGRPARRAIRP